MAFTDQSLVEHSPRQNPHWHHQTPPISHLRLDAGCFLFSFLPSPHPRRHGQTRPCTSKRTDETQKSAARLINALQAWCRLTKPSRRGRPYSTPVLPSFFSLHELGPAVIPRQVSRVDVETALNSVSPVSILRSCQLSEPSCLLVLVGWHVLIALPRRTSKAWSSHLENGRAALPACHAPRTPYPLQITVGSAAGDVAKNLELTVPTPRRRTLNPAEEQAQDWPEGNFTRHNQRACKSRFARQSRHLEVSQPLLGYQRSPLASNNFGWTQTPLPRAFPLLNKPTEQDD